ncbi:MAG TPA: PspC domain-containing protein [Candidatus Saccharimonadia bacterium]|nr:PspC domain-containing protein [Candidatus Saccharimonadia bacterium]
MNEVRNIHLGRQAYTVSADAYKDLHEYLLAIQKKAGKEVAEEVELRMAELLESRGITTEKVVLDKDVAYLKGQLGTPSDFGDDDTEAAELDEAPGSQRRLFRDMDNAMIAGVASGLAKYFDVSVLMIRLLFVLLTFFGGATVLIYLVLWLLIPEAATNSDRLQMEGKAVNVDNIKRVVERADVPGATRRATHIITRMVMRIIKIGFGIVGSTLVAVGVAVFLGAIATFVYGLVHGLKVGQVVLFPLGSEQVALLVCGFTLAVLVAGMLIISGLAILRNRGVVPVWVVATIVGIFVATAAIGTVLGVDMAPTIRDHYRSLQHTRHVTVQPFARLNFVGNSVLYVTEPGSTTSVDIRTFGKIDTNAIKVSEKDGVLTIDSSKYYPRHDCHLVCPYGASNTEVVITTPEPWRVPMDSSTRGAQLEFLMNASARNYL